jgi:hypothetical protein
MSEFWIVSAARMEEHETLAGAVHEMEKLQRHCPDKKFRVYRCKKSIHSARHFTKMVDLLRDIARDGFTKTNAERAHILLTTIGNRTPRLVKDTAA